MGPGFVTSLVDNIIAAMGEFELALAGTAHFVSVHVGMEIARQYREGHVCIRLADGQWTERSRGVKTSTDTPNGGN